MQTETRRRSTFTLTTAALCACLLTTALAAHAQIDRGSQNTARAVRGGSPRACKLSLTPAKATLPLGAAQQFLAAAVNAEDPSVTWSLQPATGTLSPAGLYTAPSSLAAPQTVTVTAASLQSPACSATAKVTIAPPVTVSLTPPSAQVLTGHTLQLTATVTGTPNTAVAWSVSGVPGGNATVGAITSAGLYTAPPLVPSPSAVTVTAASAAQSASSVLQVLLEPAPLALITSSLPGGIVGAPYNASILAAGGSAPYSFTLASGQLPAGLSIGASGSLSGAPTAAGASSFIIQARDAAGQTASRTYTISVTAAVSIVTTSLPEGTVDTAYSVTFTAAGGAAPYVFSVASGQLPSGTLIRAAGPSRTLAASASSGFAVRSVAASPLPAGLSLSASGTLSGTPTAEGSSTFTIQVADAGGQTASRSFTSSTVARLSIATASLPNATLGSAYSATVTAAGGTAPYGFSLSAGQLTLGLALSPSGSLSGAPAALGSSSFTMNVRDARGRTAQRSYTLAVIASLSLVTTSLPGGTLGAAYSATLAATGGSAPYTFSVTAGQMPAGVALSPSGTVAGTPAAAGSSSFTVQARDALGGTASQTYVVSVTAPLSIVTTSLPNGNRGSAFNATVSATGGTVPYGFSVAAGQLPPGLALSSSGALSGTPTAAGSASFTIQARDAVGRTASQAYTVSVIAPVSIVTTSLPNGTLGSAFNATVSAAGGTAPYGFSVAAGQLPAGLALSTSGSLSGTPAIVGSSSFTIQLTEAGGLTASQAYTVSVIAPLSIATTSLPDGVVGVGFSAALAATGGTAPYTFVAGLPPGLSLSAATGQISGTPTTNAAYNVTVEVTDAGGRKATKSLGLVIAAVLAITTTSLPDAAVSVAYAAALTATGGIAPLSWAIDSGQLPPGLVLDPASGAITGRPAIGGAYSFSAQVRDSRRGQEVRRTLTIGVTGAGASPAILTTSLRLGYIQQPYNAVLTAAGGTAPYVWVLAAGQLPPGLLLRAASGEITGTPTASGSYTFTAQVNDSASPQQGTTKTLTVEISSVLAGQDQYGGLLAMASPGGKSGGWAVEKYPTADGDGRWMITTPDGHGLWCGMQFGIVKPTNLNVTAKYGSELNWQTATLARYTGWGFNCLAEYTDVGLIAAMNAGSLGKRVPYFSGDHYVLDAVYRREMITGQALPADAVKDLAHTAAKITNYTHEVADGFDPNFAPFVAGFAAARVADTDIYAQAAKNPWNVAMSIDDADFMYGFGPGPDDCTTPDGVYHAHIGWMALASPLNLYAQWYDTGNPYHGWNWVFNDTKVYSKTNLVTFLKTRYGNSITALNSAWGSTYTAFDSAATRYANERVGTTDGVVGQLQHTLAHPGVSPASLLIKVDGVPMATDPPRNPGTIVGKWPDGVTRFGGTINYSTGVLTLSTSAAARLDVHAPGTTSWGTINLGHTNAVPGSIVLRLMPNDCRLTDDAGRDHAWQQYDAGLCGTAYTVTGTVDYAAGQINNLTITPAIPSGKQVQFQNMWTAALPGTHTVTVEYDVNGFGVGNTLADEDGSHTAWLGSTDGMLRKAQVPLPVWTDLSAWLGSYAEAYYSSTIDALRPYFPGKLMTSQMSGLGGHAGCPRKEIAVAAANHSDFLPFSQITQPLLDKLVTWGLGDFPVMYAWEGFLSQADSPFSANIYGGSHDLSTQELRGAAMATQIGLAINGRGSGGTSYQIIGAKFWAYSDTTGESANYGLVSPSDNAYDAVEAKTGSHPCSPPLQAYTCGGEAANYGDAVTAVRNALATWITKVR